MQPQKVVTGTGVSIEGHDDGIFYIFGFVLTFSLDDHGNQTDNDKILRKGLSISIVYPKLKEKLLFHPFSAHPVLEKDGPLM